MTLPAHYPRELEDEVVLLDGSRVSIRPIRPADASALVWFHEHLQPQTVYRRFLGVHPHLEPDEVQRFTEVDYDNRLALVAEVDGELVAVARYDRSPGTDQAEVAFVVSDAYQHLGLGTLLLRRLAAAARVRAVATFEAETLESNREMREVFRGAGFACTEDDDDGVVHVSFPLG